MLLGKQTVLGALRKVVVRTDTLDDEDVWSSVVDRGGLRIAPRLLHYIAERAPRSDELLEALRRPRVPIALAWGMDDPVSGAHVLDALQPLLAGAPVLALRGVGHYPQLEAAADIASFLDETFSAWRAKAGGTTPSASGPLRAGPRP